MSEKTIFKKILDREIPADVVYEDELCLAFRDINPQAPTHVLMIPKKEIVSIDGLSDDDISIAGHMLIAIRDMARQLGLDHGYRVVCNCGREAGQEVPHLHFHVLAGRPLKWPPG